MSWNFLILFLFNLFKLHILNFFFVYFLGCQIYKLIFTIHFLSYSKIIFNLHLNLSKINVKSFSKDLIAWYDINKRSLPWRNTNDPYKIWLSEIILQQTQIAQGLPYYINFVNEYPDVIKLAQASEQEVLKLWEGLGYYSRARNLHKAAKIVVNEFKGVFPSNYSELI